MQIMPLTGVAAVLAPALVCAAIVVSAVAWALTTRPRQASGRHTGSPATLLTGASAALLIAAIVLAHEPGWAPGRLGEIAGPLMTLLALALATIGGAPFTTSVLALAMRAAPGPNGGIVVPSKETPPDEETNGSAEDAPTVPAPRATEVLRGGTTIGLLERISAAGAILAGFPEGIAVIVALKGVGRFTELSTSEAKERFIIGSIASLLWACACTLLVR